MEEDNLQLPQIPEQFADVQNLNQFSSVDFVYNDIVSRAKAPSLLEQIDTTKKDADYFSGLFNAAQDNRFSFNEDRININEAYNRLSDGTYITRYDEGFIKGADNEEIYAQQQGSGSKWLNGLGKFVGKTAVNVVGGVLGTAYGALNAIVDGNWERVYDNDFYDFLDDQNTKMDNFAANYRTQQERDLGFFGSMGTANFWADDFLGGMSFLTGTVISEALWATITGGASLTTTAARVGLRGSKYFNTVKSLAKGVKEAQKTARKYNRLSSINRAANTATNYGRAGEILNLARFTYTGAGFEAGMEARLYEKEQKENFSRDFESLNGRPPTAQETADFESNLKDTANALWATNMALVGTSNFAILGKTFGVTSPFKVSSNRLNKVLFGNGVKTTFGEAGQRIGTKAIKRTKFQRGLGFATNVLKNPFYEGVIEEGGQATASTAMESYLTSRYNPSKEAMDIAGSFYEGLSHTYGTKEGWKEVGLGMLIGLVGGEGTNVLSGRGAFTDARNAAKEQDPESVNKAEILNKNKGTDVVDKIFATRFEQNLNHATEIQDAQQEYDEALDKGSVMGMANAQGKIMLSSVKYAVDLDYLDEQVADFEAALRMQDPSEIAENFGIEESQVSTKIDELVAEYKQIGQDYTSAKEFANYIVSDNPKELFEDGSDIDVLAARTAIAYQMVMTGIMERNMEGAHEALLDSVSQLNPQVSAEYMRALRKFNAVNRSKKEDVEALAKAENKLSLKQKQLENLNKQLLKVDQSKSNTPEGNQNAANRYNKLANRVAELQEEVAVLTQDVAEKNGRLNSTKDELSQLNASTRALANQLDSIDPLAPANDLVDSLTLEETVQKLEELDQTLKQVARTNPVLVEQITKLAKEYKNGLAMWKRNADTIADLADPKLGLKRVGTLVQKKKVAGEDTITFLRRLQKTQIEELEFSTNLDRLVNGEDSATVNDTTSDTVNEQQKAEESPGEDITQSPQQESTVESRIQELKQALRDLVNKNSFLLENFSQDGAILEQQEAPTQEEVDEYVALREKFKSGDINKLVGRPVEEIGKRVKERSGLTDQEIQRYQELSQKMLNWRIVTGTNADGVSIQDILNQIEAYQQELQPTNTQVSAEQVLEMAEEGQSEFSVDKANPDYVNSMDKVNIARDKIQTTISHLKLETLENNGFSLTYLREENRGTKDRPQIARVYEAEKDGDTFEIQYTNDHHRIIVLNKNTKAFLDGMGMQTVKYNTKTGWGYAFKDGVPMESDFGINLINNPEVNILNPQLIYKLQPGDTLSFVVNVQDVYNNEEILPLIESGNIDQAEKLMSIYVVNQNKEVVGFLKAGRKEEGSNFNKVREQAFIALQERLNNSEITLEDLANDNTNSVINLPFEVEVEKTFVGTANIELESDGSPKVFKVSPEQSDMIVDFGYAENGKLSGKLTKEKDGVRMTFIPKNKNTPYVVIQHRNTKVAFPVGLTQSNVNLQQGVLDILNSNEREQDKITQIISFLNQNGIDPSQFNLNVLNDNSAELNNLLNSLQGAPRTYTKEEISKLNKEEFLTATEILINLEKPAFVSPKIKMALSKKLIDTRTNEESKSKGLTEAQKQDLLIQHANYIARANNEQEVNRYVMETADDIFIKQYLEDTKFKNQTQKLALQNKVVPSIYTDASLENLLQDVIDTDSVDIPLDIQEQFEDEVQDLISNLVKSKIKALATKVKRATENRYKLVDSAVDTSSLYHIPTTESEQQMFDQGYVRVVGDFYKKVDKKYDVRQLLEGLYDKYRKGTLPPHMTEDYLSLEDFVEQMPNTLLDIYKMYYNTQPTAPANKKVAIVGNDQYLREDFKGDFAEFIQQEKNKGSELYKEVLQHFQISDKGILKDDLLTRDKIYQYQKELGDNYGLLLNYSLINKHIDLQEQPESIVFVEDIETTNRLQAVNNPNLLEPSAKATIINDNTISFTKVNKSFIKHEGAVYEQVSTGKQGQYIYQRIADVDPNFLITEVAPPFSTVTPEETKEIDGTKTNINKTEGDEINC